MLKTAIKILLPLLILGAALFGAVTLVKSRPKPPKQERPAQSYLVETMDISRKTHRIDVRAKGSVEAARRLELQPQLTGRLRSVSDRLVPGGIVKQGDVLARIDATDYRIALDERDAALADAEARLLQERGQQVIAERELELFQESAKKSALEDTSLALRRPQLQIAQVAVEAAKARKERARIDLARATLKAPFNALVLSESVERGQLVTPQNVLATLVGTDVFWVRASVPMAQLTRIDIPGFNAPLEAKGSAVTVRIDAGERTTAREGHVIRLLGELDQVGRLAQILIEVDDPMLLAKEENQAKDKLPLLLGSYVDIEFEGSQQRELIEIPRQALRNGEEIWVYGEGDTLDIRRVEVVATLADSVLIEEGLREGEQLITSRIGTPVEGMALRRDATQPAADKKEADQ